MSVKLKYTHPSFGGIEVEVSEDKAAQDISRGIAVEIKEPEFEVQTPKKKKSTPKPKE